MIRTALAGLTLLATAGAVAAQDFPEVFPTPHEPTRSQNRLSAVPGTIPDEAPRGGISFDLFDGSNTSAESRCIEVYDFIDGRRTLVSVRCSDD